MPELQIDIHRNLIESCIKGDNSAYYQLYQLYSRAMYNTAFRIVKNEQDAEDILQESFVSAFRNLKSFSNNSTFGAWLKKIVINKGINYLRKKQLYVLSLDESEHDLSGEEETDFEADDLTVVAVKKAINELPAGYRLVLTLYLLEGYDHKEIAEILDITVSTSKSQYNRAKKKLLMLVQQKEVIYG